MLAARLKRQNTLLVLDECEHLIDTAARVAEALLAHAPAFASSRRAAKPSRSRGNEAIVCRRCASRRTRPAAACAPKTPRRTTRLRSLRSAPRALNRALRYRMKVRRRSPRSAGGSMAFRSRSNSRRAPRRDGARDPGAQPHRRFAVLTGGLRTALPRQQTMRALIDWSYDLLPARERRAFERLSVFAGRFTLDMAVAVCSGEDETDAPSAIYSLVDKSAPRRRPRYCPVSDGGVDARVRARKTRRDRRRAPSPTKARFRAGRASRADPGPRDFEPERAWLARALPEFANQRAALGWAFGEHGEPSSVSA